MNRFEFFSNKSFISSVNFAGCTRRRRFPAGRATGRGFPAPGSSQSRPPLSGRNPGLSTIYVQSLNMYVPLGLDLKPPVLIFHSEYLEPTSLRPAEVSSVAASELVRWQVVVSGLPKAAHPSRQLAFHILPEVR